VSIVFCRCTYCCLETSHGKIILHYSRYCAVASAAAAARAEVIATYDVATVLDDSDVPGGAASFKSRD